MNDDDDNAAQQLIDAIEHNEIATVSALISSGVVNSNERSTMHLHRAATLGRVEVVALLLDAGADINAVNVYGSTCCHVAIFNNHFDTLKLLVERGANLAVIDPDYGSLLSDVARYQRKEQYVTLLLDAGASVDSLTRVHLMRLVKSVAVFNRLLARNIDLTTIKDEHSRTLCHHVAANVTRDADLCFLIDRCGAHTINAVDAAGEAPLHWAATSGNRSALRLLVELGADIDWRAENGHTALFDSCNGDSEVGGACVELLLALGANVHVATLRGQTPCHVVVADETVTELCACLAVGGSLDEPDYKGETPRMIAVREEVPLPAAADIDAARRRIAKTRLDFVRERAFQICVGLRQLNLDALQLCEILMRSFGALGSLILFHQWWAIATKVKHFHDHKSKATTAN